MVDNLQKTDYDKILVEYKQISALLFIIGSFLGSYMVLTSSSILILIFSLGVIVYGIYSYYAKPGEMMGYLLLGLGLVWAAAFVVKYLVMV